MVSSLLFDIDHINLNQMMVDVNGIERLNPHRGFMRQLDGVIWHDPGMTVAVAFKDVRDDEFWVPGHIPGRPILPGVLMIEAGAQLASFMTMHRTEGLKFIGFVGCDNVKFRKQVEPGDRLILLGKGIKFHPRRCTCDVQGLVRGSLVFEARITGMSI
jgi:3-hydroxyacyl-[acyl-carrier-protein] dehydratase